MVKVKEIYECEICNKKHNSMHEAVQCEQKGKELKILDLHQEAFLRREMSGGFSEWWLPVRVSKVEDRGHYFYYEFEEEIGNGEWTLADRGYCYGKDEVATKIKIK